MRKLGFVVLAMLIAGPAMAADLVVKSRRVERQPVIVQQVQPQHIRIPVVTTVVDSTLNFTKNLVDAPFELLGVVGR